MIGLPAGSPITPGTAERGGFAVSLARSEEIDAFTVYWLQLPGGIVFEWQAIGYTQFRFYGAPTSFREQVRRELNYDAEIWFDEPASVAFPVETMRDQNGIERLALVRNGRKMGLMWLGNNMDGSFSVRCGPIPLDEGRSSGDAAPFVPPTI